MRMLMMLDSLRRHISHFVFMPLRIGVNEQVYYIDILVSGIFFTGMWYMANKKIENWTLWIIGDVIATPLYAYRGLGMLSLQYLIFTILAVSAYLEWRKILNKSNLQL